ncbi:fasciclin domain-containing protein [Paradesertivirga mongoliensis]|uniref:Fasciclin domain-containing protein n=1 Tax=Paradesertivirga mongoliensis TaxID=2100740 RepID=A0ABW4ZS97_9SPHI|nr:fasciclin domain-containing protein [Pedobacter mongoliensis]
MNQLKGYIFIYCFLFLIITGCKDKWEDVNEVNPLLKTTLTQKIAAEPELSVFSDLLAKSRYGQILSSSLNFTVWAPSNDALASLDPAIVADSARLDVFIGNHIANSSHLTNAPNPILTLTALNGKNLIFTANTIDEITITKPNQYVANGVLHIISGRMERKPNIYEFLKDHNTATVQKDFVESLNEKQFNPATAVLLGYEPSGKPIYKEGTDSVIVNSYLNFTGIDREDSLSTYVILTNEAFLAEEVKLKPYYSTSTTDSTTRETRRAIISDLVFRGIYTKESLPDSLTSTNGVKFHLDKSAVVSSHRVSNGIVHVMNRIDYKIPNKLKTIVIEGESERVVKVTNDAGRFNFTTSRRNPDGVSIFTQVRGDNFAAALAWFRYERRVNSVKYKVYWRAVRDFDLVPIPPAVAPVHFRQRVAFKRFNATDALPYKFVETREIVTNPPSNPRVFEPVYDDVYLGEYTFSNFRNEFVFMVSNDASTTGLNSIVFDYIKLVPVVN